MEKFTEGKLACADFYNILRDFLTNLILIKRELKTKLNERKKRAAFIKDFHVLVENLLTERVFTLKNVSK